MEYNKMDCTKLSPLENYSGAMYPLAGVKRIRSLVSYWKLLNKLSFIVKTSVELYMYLNH